MFVTKAKYKLAVNRIEYLNDCIVTDQNEIQRLRQKLRATEQAMDELLDLTRGITIDADTYIQVYHEKIKEL